MFAIKRTISKFAAHVLVKLIEIEKDESDEPSDQSAHEFFIEAVNIQDPACINEIKNENSGCSITLPSNGIPVSYKIDTGAQWKIIPLKILNPFKILNPVSVQWT